MIVLRPGFNADAFFTRLARRERILFLDYDGTLAPFRVDPAEAHPYPEVTPLLRRVVQQPGSRVVIVSGRRIDDLQAALRDLPHTEAWASHGWERVAGGSVTRRIPAADTRLVLGAASCLASPLQKLGARLEEKVASVAVHWRGLSDATVSVVRAEARRVWLPLVSDRVALLHFDGGIEIRARARSKAHAVREAFSECGHGTIAAYLGDDLTDEDGFRAVQPHGLAVLVRERRRPTAAQVWLRPPVDLVRFLERWSAQG